MALIYCLQCKNIYKKNKPPGVPLIYLHILLIVMLRKTDS